VDVPFGDRTLGVAGFELHVGHWISGRRLVGQRGVAQIMERAERLRDPCLFEGRAKVFPRKARGVERGSPVRVGEDEFLVSLIRRPAPVLGEDVARARPELD
jgi:hypothetical protein